MYSSEEDLQIYFHEVRDLPHLGGFSGTGYDASGNVIPFGVGPHSVRCIRRVSEIIKSKNMLEIGFNLGYSAALWLHYTDAKLLSIDISDKAETIYAANILKKRYLDRFEFMVIDSANSYNKLKEYKFDFTFIDGDHRLQGVVNDIDLVIKLGIKDICFDDYLPQFGQVQEAIAKFPVKIIEVLGNIALGKVI